jgi:hypothetical protein
MANRNRKRPAVVIEYGMLPLMLIFRVKFKQNCICGSCKYAYRQHTESRRNSWTHGPYVNIVSEQLTREAFTSKQFSICSLIYLYILIELIKNDRRLSLENACLHLVHILLPSRILPKKVKTGLFRTGKIILLVALYRCKTWSLTIWKAYM